MSGDGDDRSGGFSGLPKWPTDAKEGPQARPAEPPRERLKWMLGFGVLGGVLGLLRGGSGDIAFLAGSMTGGFVLLALVGLLTEHVLFVNGRSSRQSEDY